MTHEDLAHALIGWGCTIGIVGFVVCVVLGVA